MIRPYTLLRLLGRGGMGSVYVAPRDDVEKVAAVKVLDGAFSPTSFGAS